jgi:two-component system phosphate regulon sensor histidine kinase PhoR
MRSRRIQWLTILASAAIVGIIISQVFWIRKGLLINQSNFENAVVQTLIGITDDVWAQEGKQGNPADAVLRLSPRSYRVDLQTPIDLNFLDTRLRSDFANPFHKVDFTYEVLEWSSDLLVFSDSVFVSSNKDVEASEYLPTLDQSTFYFKINFPQRPLIPSIMVAIWAAAILILMIVIGFFVYSITVVIRQQRLSDFQTSFINNLAHEFKTPISTIGISADVLSEPQIGEEPARIATYSNIIRIENERMKGQVNKILELASLEKREIRLQKEFISINAVLEDIVLSLSLQLNEKNGKLEKVCPDEPCYIFADKVHFVNVINTLLDNALKYTDDIPLIRFEVVCRDNDISISIADNGIGIPKEYHHKIFEKFFRVPTGDVHNVKGFGLGLSYVSLIAMAHGWKVEMQSRVGKGSTFTLILPKANHEAGE